MASAQTRPDLSGRILGFTVFLVGIALLCLVFSAAWALFRAPVAGLELPVAAGAAAPPAAGIGIALTAFVRQLLLLAVMIVSGSLVAGKGIQLYFTAAAHNHSVDDAPAGAKNGANGAAGASKTAPKQNS